MSNHTSTGAKIVEWPVAGATKSEAKAIDPRPFGAEYRQYISDGLADTDGYFAPIAYDAWVRIFAPCS